MDSRFDVVQYHDSDGQPRSADLIVNYPHLDFAVMQTPQVYNHLRVETGLAAWFLRKSYRTFYRFAVPALGTVVVRAIIAQDTVLSGLDIDLVNAEIRMETVVGGTPGGSFSTALPIFNRNNLPGVLVPSTAALAAGGTHTGGTILDEVWIKAGNNAQQANSVGARDNDMRGIALGTYYFRLVNPSNSQADGVLRIRWEEQ